MAKKLKVGIIGLGTVGSGVFKTLQDFTSTVEVVQIATKDLDKAKGVKFNNITDDASQIVNNPEIDVVVEVAGGAGIMFEFVKKAILNGKHIVTANKELLAKHGAEIMDLANKNNVVVLYEAAVAGGIPIINTIKTSLRANEFSRVSGILNGTTNYILTKMEERGASYQEVLKEAQDLGYAEADPTGDVDGYDTMYKTAILANIVFHKRIDLSKIYREGITKISAQDICVADELGYKIKLIGLAQKEIGGELDIRVHPMLVSKQNVISSVNNAINAVSLLGEPVSEVMFTGPGAGEFPTASSVVGDILAIAATFDNCENILPQSRCTHSEMARQMDIKDTSNKYYMSIVAKNVTGTIGLIGTICGNNKINLSSILQKGINSSDGTANIVVVTESCLEADIQNAIKELEGKEGIKVNNLIRIMD